MSIFNKHIVKFGIWKLYMTEIIAKGRLHHMGLVFFQVFSYIIQLRQKGWRQSYHNM